MFSNNYSAQCENLLKTEKILGVRCTLKEGGFNITRLKTKIQALRLNTYQKN